MAMGIIVIEIDLSKDGDIADDDVLDAFFEYAPPGVEGHAVRTAMFEGVMRREGVTVALRHIAALLARGWTDFLPFLYDKCVPPPHEFIMTTDSGETLGMTDFAVLNAPWSLRGLLKRHDYPPDTLAGTFSWIMLALQQARAGEARYCVNSVHDAAVDLLVHALGRKLAPLEGLIGLFEENVGIMSSDMQLHLAALVELQTKQPVSTNAYLDRLPGPRRFKLAAVHDRMTPAVSHIGPPLLPRYLAVPPTQRQVDAVLAVEKRLEYTQRTIGRIYQSLLRWWSPRTHRLYDPTIRQLFAAAMLVKNWLRNRSREPGALPELPYEVWLLVLSMVDWRPLAKRTIASRRRVPDASAAAAAE